MSTCGACGTEQPEGSRFCFSCGTVLASPVCASCGEQLVPGARFCSSCGAVQHSPGAAAPPATAPAAPQVARRVTSVLFGDLVGFTALAESRDQEDVADLQSRYFEECRRVIGRYGGTVEKFIGDAVMAVWGVPTAHEDDAERAVRAGLELTRAVGALADELAVPELAMRVGIVTGEVAVTIGAQQQGMVSGEAVNTASRVQGAAQPGQVWVDETTRLLTTSAITYLDVGSHRLRGRTDPMPLWAVRAVVASVGGAQRADGLEAPLVGRDRELRVFQELFHSCEETRRPAMIVVDGDAGVGKTRLVWEFEKYVDGLTSSFVKWHSGRCLAYGEGVAFYALAEAVRGRLRALSTRLAGDQVDEEADDAAVLADALAQLVDDEEERAWLSPRLGVLLGIGSIGGFAREDLFSAWTTFLERVGQSTSPVVLVLDDAQYADDGLLQYVEHLLAVGGFSCFVVLLTRPGLLERQPSLATNRRGTVVHLPALSDGDVARLLDGLVAGLPASVRQTLVERSEGVPLFAVETVRSLIDRDLVIPRGGQYVLADPGALDLDAIGAPASLQALIAARLDTLSADQRRLVNRACVLGDSFAREEIQGLCPDLDDLDGVLAGLVRLQMLSHESRRFSAGFGGYQFVQSVVRQVAYGSLSRRDRKATHLAVVAQLEGGSERAVEDAAILAQHLLDAIEAGPTDLDVPQLQERAVAQLRVAAERARGLGSPHEAAGHLGVALRLTTAERARAEIEEMLAVVLLQAGRFSECTEHASRAVELFAGFDERVAAGRVAATQATATAAGGDNEAAIVIADPWWRELQDHEGSEEALLPLSRVLATANARLNREHRSLLEDFVRLAEAARDAGALADAYSSLSTYYSTIGSISVARILLRASADLAREHHQPSPLVVALSNLASASMVDDLDEAVRYADEGATVAQSAGQARMLSFANVNLLLARWARGDWADVRSSLIRAEVSAEDVTDNVWMVVAALLADAQATEPVRDLSLIGPAKGDDPIDLAWELLARGVAASVAGDRTAAVRLTVDAVRRMHEKAGVWEDMTTFWPSAVELALAAGDEVSMAWLLSIVDDLSRRAVPDGLAAHRHRIAGLLSTRAGDPVGAEVELRDAVAGFERWGAHPYSARARAELGLCLRAQGRHDEGTALFEEACSQLRELGASGWLAQLADAASRVAVAMSLEVASPEAAT